MASNHSKHLPTIATYQNLEGFSITFQNPPHNLNIAGGCVSLLKVGRHDYAQGIDLPISLSLPGRERLQKTEQKHTPASSPCEFFLASPPPPGYTYPLWGVQPAEIYLRK
jgi:hypothetical protein